LDQLIADFNDQPALPEAVFVIGEQYYNLAFQCEKAGLSAKAKDKFQKAIEVWGRIITELSPSSTTTEAYYFSAACYRHLDQYETAIDYYQKVVNDWPDYQYAWNAQFMIARCLDRLARSGAISKADAAPIIRQACENLLNNYPDSMAVNAATNLMKRWESVNSK
jgi:tetratricopeptide (TPR) repeat protein